MFILDFDNLRECPEGLIGQLDELTCCTQVHRHDFFSLIWLLEGHSQLFVDFHYYNIKQGTLVCIPPDQVHAWSNQLDGREIGIGFSKGLYIKQNQEFPEFLYSLKYTNDKPFIQEIPSSHHGLFDFVFNTALERCDAVNDPQSYDEALLTYLNVILLEMRRLQDKTQQKQVVTFDASSRLVREFENLVERYYGERKKVYEFADELGVTANHLVQTVRERTMKTPGKMISERLLLEAKRQLIHTTDTITEIAFTLSFTSPSQFNRWFKNEAGLSPGQFRDDFIVFAQNP